MLFPTMVITLHNLCYFFGILQICSYLWPQGVSRIHRYCSRRKISGRNDGILPRACRSRTNIQRNKEKQQLHQKMRSPPTWAGSRGGSPPGKTFRLSFKYCRQQYLPSFPSRLSPQKFHPPLVVRTKSALEMGWRVMKKSSISCFR